MQINKITKLTSQPIIKNSIVLFIGTSIANTCNYFWHLIAGRTLGPQQYSSIASLISLTYLASIPITTLLTSITKFTASYQGKKQNSKISALFYSVTQKFIKIDLVLVILIILLSQFIARFLKIPSISLVIISLAIPLLALMVNINLGILQGIAQFMHLSVTNTLTAIIKILLTLFLLKTSYPSHGVIIAILLSTILQYFISFSFIKKSINLKKAKTSINLKPIIQYSLPTLIVIFGLNSLYNSDIILAKHFLGAQQAGLYSALCQFGKIIFFASSPIVIVMFSLVAQKHEQNKKNLYLLIYSLVTVGLISLSITILYRLFPQNIVKLLFGNNYLGLTPFLYKIGISMGLFSLANTLIQYFLSIHKLKHSLLAPLIAILQIIAIALYHSDIKTIIHISIASSTLLLISSTIVLIMLPTKQHEK